MWNKLTWAPLTAALCLALSWPFWWGGDSSPQGRPGAVDVKLSSLQEQRVARGNEWRDARFVPAGRHAVDLGAVPAGGALRLAFSTRGMRETPARVTVYVGDKDVKEIPAREATRWTVQRVDLAPVAAPGAPCRVVIDSQIPVLLAECELTPSPKRAPNVLIFLVDAMRPDHLGCYGYTRDTSPNMDALAREGVRFDGVISQSSWTRPAVASLLTSTYPAVHGAKDRADIMRQDLPTVAGTFQAAGYETEGFMSNPSCLPMWGFGRGFDRYVDVDSCVVNSGKDQDVVDDVLAAVDEAAGRPWFFYVHAIGPHSPYDPPAPYDAKFAEDAQARAEANPEEGRTKALYDGEIAFTDLQFGRLMAELKRLGIYDDTVVVLLADHGEEFWEHGGNGHGTTLFDEQIRIPLVIKLPDSKDAGRVVHGIQEIIDVAPTVLDIARLQAPKSFEGVSLAPQLDGAAQAGRPAFSSLFLEKNAAFAARDQAAKYINDLARRQVSWYNLAVDPGEQHASSDAPGGEAPLAVFASRIVSGGSDGLHILVTGSLLDLHTITGTIKGNDLGEYDLRYDAKNGEVSGMDGGLQFRITTSPGPGSPPGIADWHETGAEQNNAHLKIAAPGDQPLTLSLELDGKPIPESMVYAGAEQAHRPLDNTVLCPKDLTAKSEDFEPSILPRRLAVYLWYVPGAKTVTDKDLKPEMVNAFQALGYL